MLFRDSLCTFAGSKSKARVLGLMAAYPTREWTGNALAKEAGISQPQAWKAANELEKQGIVSGKRAGMAVLWRFNPAHLMAPALMDFARPKLAFGKMLVLRLRKAGALDGVCRIAVFGSVARGDERPDSDLDLFVEVGKGADKRQVSRRVLDSVSGLAEVVGSPVVPVFYSTAEIREKKNNPFLKEISRHWIQVYPE